MIRNKVIKEATHENDLRYQNCILDTRYGHFSNCMFFGCTFKDMTSAIFTNCLFSVANFRGSLIEHASFFNCHGDECFFDLESKVPTGSRFVISQILWRAAHGDTERQMVASFIGRKEGWCWAHFLRAKHSQRDWALGVLGQWPKLADEIEIRRYML